MRAAGQGRRNAHPDKQGKGGEGQFDEEEDAAPENGKNGDQNPFRRAHAKLGHEFSPIPVSLESYGRRKMSALSGACARTRVAGMGAGG